MVAVILVVVIIIIIHRTNDTQYSFLNPWQQIVQLDPEQRSRNLWNSRILQSSPNSQNPPNSRISSCAPQQTPIYILSVTSMAWNISTAQLGLTAWLCSLPAPAHLLVSWTQETEKSPWFLSNNYKHQCIMNILHILNPKHSSYWEEN